MANHTIPLSGPTCLLRLSDQFGLPVWLGLFKRLALPSLFGILLPGAALAAGDQSSLARDMVPAVFIFGILACAGIIFMMRLTRHLRSEMEHMQEQLRKKTIAFNELDTARKIYKGFYDLAMVGIFRTTTDGSRFLAINQTGAELFGYASPAEMLTLATPRQLYITEGTREVLLQQLLQKRILFNQSGTFRRRDGSTFHTLYSVKHTTEGYIEGTFQDVTPLRLAQMELSQSRDYLQKVIDAIPLPIFVRDAQDKFTIVNDEYAQSVGLSKKELLGNHPRKFFPETTIKKLEALEEPLRSAGGRASQRYEMLWTHGEFPQYHIVYNESMQDSEGQHAGFVTAVVDITARKAMEEALREAEERYRAIYMNAVDGIFSSTKDGTFLEANPAMARIYGYASPDEMLRAVENLATEHWVQPEQRNEMVALLEKEKFLSGYEIQIHRRDGEQIWVALSIRLVQNDGSEPYLEGIATDITEHKLTSIELALKASTDPLTGLANRHTMEHSFEHMIAQASRSGERLGVLFIDLDGFKPINDTYGHEAGDNLLKSVSERLRKRVRDADLAARIGGDEFVIILWDVQDIKMVYTIGCALLEELNSPYEWKEHTLQVGASIGGCLFPDHGTTVTELLRCADKAMYTIKQSGKNALRVAGATKSACSFND